MGFSRRDSPESISQDDDPRSSSENEDSRQSHRSSREKSSHSESRRKRDEDKDTLKSSTEENRRSRRSRSHDDGSHSSDQEKRSRNADKNGDLTREKKGHGSPSGNERRRRRDGNDSSDEDRKKHRSRREHGSSDEDKKNNRSRIEHSRSRDNKPAKNSRDWSPRRQYRDGEAAGAPKSSGGDGRISDRYRADSPIDKEDERRKQEASRNRISDRYRAVSSDDDDDKRRPDRSRNRDQKSRNEGKESSDEGRIRDYKRERDGEDRYRSSRRYDSRRGRDHRQHDEDRERRHKGSYGEQDKNDSRDSEGRRADAHDGTAKQGNGRQQFAAEKAAQLNTSKGANTAADDKILGRSGGVYIPPFKLAQMMKDIQDKSSAEYQRMTWDALRKSINGLVNKVNTSNIKNIIPELLSENLIRGRGLFARSCMKSQLASPSFTHVFAALVAVVNTKFPELGKLLLKRVILQFRRALKRNDKPLLLAAAKFIAHLVNQQVAHEVVALEVLMVLLENPTDDSVEVSVGFVKESGAILQDLAPQGLHGIFERFRGILHEGEIDKRVQFMIEGLFAIRKAGFQGHQAVLPELDLVDQEDQLTHEVSLSDELDAEIGLDIFKPDPNFLENEKIYEDIKKDILGEDSSDDNDDDDERGSGSSDESDEDDEDEEAENERMQIKDETETNLVNLRRTIYLTIMSSVDFEEAGHKLLKIKLEPGQEMELNIMLLECCSQERTYLRYYGLLGQRFCMINKVYQENFDECFVKQYSMIHRLETNKLRNVAKFFAHLLGTDALPWNVLGYIRLTEEDTTSSSRIFIKILFQELSEHLGLRKLNEKLNDPLMQDSFEGIFPKDNPKNTRFAINFFTSIGLGGITDSLREYLKNMPRLIMQQQRQVESESESSDSDASSDSDSETSGSGSSGSSDSDSGSSSSSESEPERKRKRR